MDKKNLRRKITEKRNNLYKNTCEFNLLCEQLQEKLIEHWLFVQAENICLYAPVRSEINTHKIAQKAWEMKKNVFYPKCSTSPAEKGIMHFHACRDFSDLKDQGCYGLLEPASSCILADEKFLDSNKTLVLVPALSYNGKGYRLGYGQGFYDRFLVKIPQAITMGICFTVLMSEEIPVENWDIPVQYLATEQGMLII